MRVAVVGVVLTTGCAGPGPVDVALPTPPPAVAAQCADLLAAVPSQVDGQDRREVSAAGGLVAAWGDPAIVLRCGVDKPAALKRTSLCFAVDGIGWLATHDGREVDPARPVVTDLEFTTIGRSAYVDVVVPSDYQPQADPLVDLADAISAATRELHPCV